MIRSRSHVQADGGRSHEEWSAELVGRLAFVYTGYGSYYDDVEGILKMLTVMLFLHIVGAVGMGIYAILPFLIGKIKKVSAPAQEGMATGLVTAGRLGQYALVLQLITGGYLITGTGTEYSVSWMIVSIGVFLVIGALTGIIQGPLKRIAKSASGQSVTSDIGRVQTLSAITFVLFIVIIWIMQSTW